MARPLSEIRKDLQDVVIAARKAKMQLEQPQVNTAFATAIELLARDVIEIATIIEEGHHAL